MSSGNKHCGNSEGIELWSRHEKPPGVAPEAAKWPSRIHGSVKILQSGTQPSGGAQESIEVVRRYDGGQPPNPGDFETRSERIKHLSGSICPSLNRELIN